MQTLELFKPLFMDAHPDGDDAGADLLTFITENEATLANYGKIHPDPSLSDAPGPNPAPAPTRVQSRPRPRPPTQPWLPTPDPALTALPPVPDTPFDFFPFGLAGRYAFLVQEARGCHRRVRVPPGAPTVLVRDLARSHYHHVWVPYFGELVRHFGREGTNRPARTALVP